MCKLIYCAKSTIYVNMYVSLNWLHFSISLLYYELTRCNASVEVHFCAFSVCNIILSLFVLLSST